MELNLYCFHDDAFKFHGQDTGIMTLQVVTQVYVVLSHGRFV